MKTAANSPARERVLFTLKTQGPQTAAELARRLGVTPMAVRQHLQALADQALVAFRDERRKVGRPARVWSLTEAAASRFPDSHSELTVDLLGAVRATFGPDGLDRLISERGRRQRADYQQRMPPPSAPLEERVAALAALRSQEGYMSDWSRDDDGSLVLAENHCPICAAATACQGLCRDELLLFRELLGDRVNVDRAEHILAGARRCAYRIKAVGGASSPVQAPKAPGKPVPAAPAGQGRGETG